MKDSRESVLSVCLNDDDDDDDDDVDDANESSVSIFG